MTTVARTGPLIIHGQRLVGSAPAGEFRPYRYGGNVPLEKDPEIHRSMSHGNASAARLHYLRGEKPCDECRESERERWREAARRRKERGKTAGVKAVFSPEKCGTNAGHQRHIYHSDPPCDPCMAAHRAYQQARRDARKAAKNAARSA